MGKIEIDWKKFQFIITAQTAIINNATNLALEEDAKETRHIFSATGTLIIMDQLFQAAENIPDELSAFEAANEFVGYFCDNLREEGSKLPRWCEEKLKR